MLLLGTERLYASHLPLYRPPHAAQVVLEVELVDAALRAAYRAERAGARLVTFEPDAFDLARLAMAPPLEAMHGTIYDGHFERGGEVWRGDVTLRVRQVIVYRTLDPKATDGPRAFYVVADEGARTSYAIRRIGGQPDCDVITRVRGVAPGARRDAGQPLEDRGGSLDPCAPPSPAFITQLGGHEADVIYDERDDLR